MNKIHCLFIFWFWLYGAGIAHAQSFTGYDASSYSGVYGTLYNPANILDHRFRADVNLMGLSAGLNNNVIRVNLSDPNNPLQFANPIRKTGRGGFLMDALGPGAMLRLSDKHAVAITTRFRMQANADRLDNTVLNIALQEDATPWNGKPIILRGGSLQAHSWNELAFTYSRQIGVSDFGVWKAALSLKVLGGQGAAYLNSNRLDFTYNDSMRVDTVLRIKYGGAVKSKGNINVNYASFIDDWGDSYQYRFFRQPGLGADIGFTYEYRDEMQVYDTKYNEETLNYKWKAGVSLTDIGSIRYQSSVNSYNSHLTGQTYVFEDLMPPEDSITLISVANFYKRRFPGTPSYQKFRMSLPTTLHLTFDYSFNAWLSAQSHLSVPILASEPAYYIGTHSFPQITITPRAELPWIGAYMPVTYAFTGGLQVGGALRLGPLVVGSASFINTFLVRKTKTADAYFILRIPFFGYRAYDTEPLPQTTKFGKLARKIFQCRW